MEDTERTVSHSGDELVPCHRCAVSRRTILMGVGTVGLAGLLTACGGDDGAEPSGAGSANPEPGDTAAGEASPSDPAETEAETEPETEETAAEEGAAALTTVSEVPVGGGVILNGPGVVVTQPAEGEFVAFSNVCTHQGCAVTDVSDGLIKCPCHGSQYSVADGSVQQGPAPQALPEVPIVVEGDQILPG